MHAPLSRTLPPAFPPVSQVLDIAHIEGGLSAAHAALASLPHLQRCLLGENFVERLPAGQWLHSLRWLSAYYKAVAGSVAVLRAAHALEFVELYGRYPLELSSPAAAALFDWLAEHPPLRRVCFAAWCGAGDDQAVLKASLAQLSRRRPGLRVECRQADQDCMFLQLLEAD